MLSLALLLSIISYIHAALAAEAATVWPGVDQYGSPVASINLATDQEFGNSYGKPFTTLYTPPSVSFNRIGVHLDVKTTGLNYDRLAIFYLDDIEFWRSSTSEPGDDDSYWSYDKDVSHYLSAFQDSHTFKLLLNNIVSGGDDGTFTVNVTVNFYNSAAGPVVDDAWVIQTGNFADKIVALQSGSDYWSLPGDSASVSVDTLDTSVNRALLHIFASGSADDEFWWDTTGAPGPSRFVDVTINGVAAGFVTPYASIFSGGMDPDLWRPIVNIRTYDLPGYYIDVTPFLPSFWAGKSTIELKVTNGIDSSTVPSSWLVNANLLTWSTSGQTNSGSLSGSPQISTSNPSLSTGDIQKTTIDRVYSSKATLVIGGQQQTISWAQNATFSSTVWNQGNNVAQFIQGSDSFAGSYDLQRSFNYPMQVQISSDYIRVQSSYDIGGVLPVSSWIDTHANTSGNSVTDYGSRCLFTGSVTLYGAADDNKFIVTP